MHNLRMVSVGTFWFAYLYLMFQLFGLYNSLTRISIGE